ncbi:hypothetical protein [Leucobacter tenebrionis]|uniref:hypothetical protein n=1 Tax=Leucobacter tenebrionis TaxID=2873270 RepID=UPI001CA73EF1|nr:hypothetical protein [Leucobacter tenebrionis]QZY52095.1 hypothetical protein KVY00_01035 [Leucobacter tenebrionis]
MADASRAGTGNRLCVLVVADPGLPSRRAHDVRHRLENALAAALASPVEVRVRTELIRIDPDDTLDITDVKHLSAEYERVDAILMITEIPRHRHGKPLVAEVLTSDDVGVVSLPTLGAGATRRRLVAVLVACAQQMHGGWGDERDRISWARWVDAPENSNRLLQSRRLVGGARTVLGMVLTNQPWRILPKLSSALAAAAAAGAFGIFYNSIWQMSAVLSPARLAVISVLAICVIVAWLLIGNRLWDRPGHASFTEVILLYNLSTVLTLVLCVLALYVSLTVIILLSALIVIDPDFMSEVLGSKAEFSNYLDIAVLSAAMGTVAGALGSSFDRDADVRQLTHGRRERQRINSEEE